MIKTLHKKHPNGQALLLFWLGNPKPLIMIYRANKDFGISFRMSKTTDDRFGIGYDFTLNLPYCERMVY